MRSYRLILVLILTVAGFSLVFIGSAEDDWYARGLQAYGNGSYTEALLYLNASLEQNPDDTWTHYQTGETYWAQDNPAAALDSYRKAVILDETNPWAWYGIGKVLSRNGDPDAAEDAYRKAVSLDPDNSWAWVGLGDSAIARQQYPEAISAYEAAIRVDPGNAEAWKKKGQYHDETSSTGLAIVSYQKVTLLDPGDFWGWFLLGVALRDAGMDNGSKDALFHAYQNDPDLFTETIKGWGSVRKLTGTDPTLP